MEVAASYERGFEFRCLGQYPEAKTQFEAVLAVEPNHVRARHQLALILGFEGDFDASLAALQALCEEVPADNEVRCDLAMTQMMLGEYEPACANLRLILASDPTHEKANQQIIYC